MEKTPNLGLKRPDDRDLGWGKALNYNFTILDGAIASIGSSVDWQESVKDKDLNDPPATPSAGDRYIVGPSPTGAWDGHARDIAEWNGSSWGFIAKNEGMQTFVEDEGIYYVYHGVWGWLIDRAGDIDGGSF